MILFTVGMVGVINHADTTSESSKFEPQTPEHFFIMPKPKFIWQEPRCESEYIFRFVKKGQS